MPRNKRNKSKVSMVHLEATMEERGSGGITKGSYVGLGGGITTTTTYSLQGVITTTGGGKKGMKLRGGGVEVEVTQTHFSTTIPRNMTNMKQKNPSWGTNGGNKHEEGPLTPPTLPLKMKNNINNKDSKNKKADDTNNKNRNCSSADSSGIGGSGSGVTTPEPEQEQEVIIIPQEEDKEKSKLKDIKKGTTVNGKDKGTTKSSKSSNNNNNNNVPPSSTTPSTKGTGKDNTSKTSSKSKSKSRSSTTSTGSGGSRSGGNCPCPCCGEIWATDDEYDDDYSGSDWSSGDDWEEEVIRGSNRMNMFVVQNAKAKLMLQKSNKYYKKILSAQKIIREQQLMVMQRANKLNAVFIRNMEAIMRLGFCPMLLQQRTDWLSNGLLEVHRLIQDWDDKLDDLIPVPRSKKGPYTKTILPSLLQVFKRKYGKNAEGMTDVQFEEALKKCLEEIPDLIPDEESVKAALEEMDLMEIESEWEIFEEQVEKKLFDLEKEFIDLCVEFGIRIRLPRVTGYEWAHPVSVLEEDIRKKMNPIGQRKPQPKYVF